MERLLGGDLLKIAVAGKGGVGKSVVVALIANALRREGRTVLALDADESNPGLHRMFGFDREPEPLMRPLSRFSLDEPDPETQWLAQDEIYLQDIPSGHLIEEDNLKFLAIGKIRDPFEGCACTIAGVTRDLLGKLTLKDDELVVVDMEAGIESFGRGVERSVDTVLIVVEPSFESLALAARVRYLAEGIGVNKVRAILNKVPSKNAEERILEELDKKGVTPIGTVYYDPQISEACFEGRALGDCQAVEDIKSIVRSLLTELE